MNLPRQVWREMWREGKGLVSRIAELIAMKHASLSVILLSHLAAMRVAVTMLPRNRLDLRSGGSVPTKWRG
jgi:hypothetical protein